VTVACEACVTVSVAVDDVTVDGRPPARVFVTMTLYEPASDRAREENANDAAVSPVIATPPFNHWYDIVPPSLTDAVTDRVTD
jgi:hypothetical protein